MGRAGNGVVEELATQMVGYLDRAAQRSENGLRTWLGVRVSLRLRELEAGANTGETQ